MPNVMVMVSKKDKLLLMSQEKENLGYCFSKYDPEPSEYPQCSLREATRSRLLLSSMMMLAFSYSFPHESKVYERFSDMVSECTTQLIFKNTTYQILI